MQSPPLSAHFARSIRTLSAFCLAAAICAPGCGGSTSTVPVTGHVNYRGQPLANGFLTFFPVAGRPTSAAISEDGSYQAQLEPGEYIVAVGVGLEMPAGYKLGDSVPPPKFVLPVQYTSRAKSTLKASVQPGQSEPINFDLK